MPANTSPLFPITAVAAVAQVSSAQAALDGTGAVDVYTPGANGGRIEYIRVKALVATTTGMIRLYIYNGANYRLWHELPVTAITPSATVESFEGEVIPTRPLVLPSGYKLAATTEKAETFNVFAHGGDF